MSTEQIKLALLRLDGGTQPRAAIDQEVVADYRERMEEGDKFPPVIVFYDGTHFWLADGFHRVHAAKAASFTTIEATVKQGTLADAQWFSYSANRSNGMRRTNEDKRRAVESALRTHTDKSDRQIAAWIGVSDKTVSAHRVSTCGNSAPDSRRIGRDGKSYPATQPERQPQAVRTLASEIGADEPDKPTRTNETTIVNTDTGEVIDNAEVVKTTTTTSKPKPRGIGLDIGYEAIALLKTIPPTDGLRTEAMELVARWIEHNK